VAVSDGLLIGRLAVALLLSSAIGVEREFRRKPAGLRTVTLVGVGAAIAMMVSKYGFGDMQGSHISLDPSRIAAQIVSGVGFLGAGIIFVRRDSVSGLTTAAVVWVTAMIGMAVGAGMLAIASIATLVQFIVALGYPSIVRHVPRSPWAPVPISVEYYDARGVLRDVLGELTSRGFSVSHLTVERKAIDTGLVAVAMQVVGKGPSSDLAVAISALDGVVSVATGEGETG